jgi:quinol monooxygenase YgiN
MKHLIGLLAGLMVAVAGYAPAAWAAEGGTAYIVTYFEVNSAAKDKAAGLLRQLAKASRKDAGNLRFEALQRIGQGDQFAILEAWKDKDAHGAHAVEAHTRQFRDKLSDLLRSAYDERPHTALEVGEVPAKAGKGAVFAITHVDIVPKEKDAGVALTKAMVAEGRKAKGNIRFEALTQDSRTNHMTVTELWASRGAMEAQSATPGMKHYREKLSPMSGSLYDERLYKALD